MTQKELRVARQYMRYQVRVMCEHAIKSACVCIYTVQHDSFQRLLRVPWAVYGEGLPYSYGELSSSYNPSVNRLK